MKTKLLQKMYKRYWAIVLVVGFMALFAVDVESAQQYRDESVSEKVPGLVAHYTFEEGPGDTIKDHSGHGNHGKNLGAKYVKGPEGTGFALRFDDAKAMVNCGNKPSFDLTEAVTMELWLYPETTPKKGLAGLVGRTLGSSSYTLAHDGWFFVNTSSRRNDCGGAAGSPLLTWNHIVVTFNGRYLKSYRNGKLRKVVEAGAEKQKINSSSDPFYLRFPVIYGGKVKPVHKCMMDDVRIYNRALSEEEVLRHYRNEAKNKGKDVTAFDKVKLTPTILAGSSMLLVEAGFSQMRQLLSPGAKLCVELRNKALGKVVASHEAFLVMKQGNIEFDWILSPEDAPAGDYELIAVVKDKNGAQVGITSSVDLKIAIMKKRETPAWVRAYDDVKILNNMVAELLSVQTTQKEAVKEYTFKNPRDGWVFISLTAPDGNFEKMVLSIAPVPEGEEVILHGIEKGETLEVMRQLPTGAYKLSVRCKNTACPTALTVRAIPELIYTGLGYGITARADNLSPFLKNYGPYTWEFIERISLIENLNVILERGATRPENAQHLADWRKQGKKVLKASFTTWLTKQDQPVTAETTYTEWSKYGFQSPGYYGTLMSEFGGGPHFAKEYPAFTEAIRRIARNPKFKGKVFYPYTSGLYKSKASRAFAKAVIDAGYKLAEEVYLEEQPTEKAARDYINAKLRRNILRYQDVFPDFARHMIITPAFFSIPHLSVSIYPGVDLKVYMDMQMHLIANDPAFFGTYGVAWYHTAYADEELMRWSAKLNRHYCIEGNKERLTSDPYILPHISNPDFTEGGTAWKLEPAEKGSIVAGQALGYGHIQGRFRAEHGQGNKFLLTRRSAKTPNRFSQTIRKLTPGRLYSFRMFITDYEDLSGRKSVEKTHDVSVEIDGVDLIPEKSFSEVFVNTYSHGGFSRANPLYMTFQRIVFRAQSETARLVISDWTGKDELGGPEGQKLAFNFIEVQPYLED
jgi:hypothetical protein